jgi:hypothetical protein
MSRRKVLVKREANGRPQRLRDPELMSPTETRRLVEAAAIGLKDSIWSSQLGRLHLTGRLSSSQFSAGKRWCDLVANYATACQAPRPPQSAKLEPGGSMPADPDSAIGVKEARRHERATIAYLDGRHALRLAGHEAERDVDTVCVQNQAPAGLCELDALRRRLQSLSAYWSTGRKLVAR